MSLDQSHRKETWQVTLHRNADKAARDGWWIGLAIIAVVAIVLALNHALFRFRFTSAAGEADIPLGVIYYLGIAAAAIALTRIGQLTAASYMGLELKFQDPVLDKVNQQSMKLTELADRIERIEKGLENVATYAPATTVSDEAAVCPDLPPIQAYNDQQKYRFGEKSVSGAYELTAKFLSDRNARFVNVRLIVERTDKKMLEGTVRFYLHETFKPHDEVIVTARDGVATLDLLVRGGFTVGAWIPSERVKLELDLSRIPDAPRIIKEL